MEEKNKKEVKKETEEELREKLKAEIRAELLEELKNENLDKTVLKKPANSSSEKVHFDNYKAREEELTNEMNRKEKSTKKKETADEKEKDSSLTKEKGQSNSKGSMVVMLVCLVIIAITVYSFPYVYRFLTNASTKPDKLDSSNTSSNDKPVYEKITVESKILNKFTYPIMRNSQYEKNSYYQKDSITMSEFSNNDILYNAFIHVYTGSIAPYTGGYAGKHCVTPNTQRTINPKYLEARIENLFSRNTKYKHATFTVPSTNKDTEYVGTWVYDTQLNMYVYYGDCVGVKPSTVSYYDLKHIYDASGNSNNTVIEVMYYMGFAAVNGNTKEYTIYSDANMTDVLTNGVLTTNDSSKELETIFNDYVSGKHQAKSYKYTFSSNNCSYQDYCFEKGEWVK